MMKSMHGRLAGTAAIVTGAGSGIGQAIAERFSAEGSAVAAVDINAAHATETAERIRASGGAAIAIRADVSNESMVLSMVREAMSAMGPIDILVNNAGLSKGNNILNMDEETWNLNQNVVLKSVFLCSKAMLPAMIKRASGAIVNISSVNGLGGFGEEAYSAAKAGMINLTKNLAVRHGPSGVRVNCIAPGTVRTPIWQDRIDKDPAVLDKLSRWYPLRRVGEPEDVANAALFLASAEAAWITGEVLVVDGGLTAGNGLIGSEIPYEP